MGTILQDGITDAVDLYWYDNGYQAVHIRKGLVSKALSDYLGICQINMLHEWHLCTNKVDISSIVHT